MESKDVARWDKFDANPLRTSPYCQFPIGGYFRKECCFSLKFINTYNYMVRGIFP